MSVQVELESPLDISASSIKTEQESMSSNCGFKGTQEQTFHWFEEPEDLDDLCSPEGEASKDDVGERHAKLDSSFVRLEDLGTKKRKTCSKTTRLNVLQEAN
jgi:hypothetical protein